MKTVKAKLAETNPERIEAFEKGAAAYAKKIVANFKDFEFVGRSHYQRCHSHLNDLMIFSI